MREMQRFDFGDKIPVVVTDYATLSVQIELNSNQVFLHIDGFDPKMWSKTIYLDMLDVLNETEKYVKEHFGVEQLFVMIDANDNKLIKFEIMFGFFPYYELFTSDGPFLIMFKEI